jgi:RHS repeat-associated protein
MALPGALALGACDVDGPTWRPTLVATPGLPRYQRAAVIPVPGGLLNVAGGNLLVRRVDLSIDTRLGTREVGAVYNSCTRLWQWSFELHYDGRVFVDASGARHDAAAVADGARIPGSAWVRLDALRLRSVGGLVHVFDAGGRLAAVHWASGSHPRLEYRLASSGGELRVAEVRQCRSPDTCRPVFAVERDDRGNVVALSDRAGRRADFRWNAAGHLVTARDALDTARQWPGWRYDYDPEGRLLAVTSSEGERVEYATRPGLGRLEEVRQVGAEHPVQRFRYGSDASRPGADAPAYWTRHFDPLGHVTEYRYDRRYRLHRVALPTGEVSEREWSGLELARLTAPDGAVTTWERSAPDTVVRHDPNGNAVRVDFRLHGGENREAPFERAIDSIEDSLGLRERRSYRDGRLAWLENGAGERTRFDYDAENMLARVTGPGGVFVELAQHAEHGHPEVVRFAGETESRVYDAVGNLVSRSGLGRFDFRPGGERERHWDPDRNLAALVQRDAPPGGPAAEIRVVIERRSDGRPLRIARPGGGDHVFVYDALGRLVERRERADGVWHGTRLERDAAGRVTAEELPNGMRREWDYDASGRLRALRALRDGTLEQSAQIEHRDGRLHAVRDSAHDGPELYRYDAGGALAAVVFPGGEELQLAHDLRGRRTSERYLLPGGSLLAQLDLGYDGADRETAVRESGALLLERVYAAGRLETLRYGNGLARSFAHDPASGLPLASQLDHPTRGRVATSSVGLTQPAPGELRLTSHTTSGGTAAATSVETYTLGAAGAGPGEAGLRLRAEDAGAGARAYAYDGLGRVLERSDGVAFDANAEGNRLLRTRDAASGATRTAYRWDAAGYAVARGDQALVWSAHGRIVALGDAASFAWDALGRPLSRRVAGRETRLLFGGRVEADASGAPLRLDRGDVVIELSSREHRYRHRDFRGNAKLVSDADGDVVTHHVYAGYGPAGVHGLPDPASGFAGGRHVAGLVVLGPRVLDPDAGRFLGPDPLPWLLDAHVYAGGNPVWFRDASGLQAEAADLPAAAERALGKMAFGMLLTSVGAGLGVSGAPVAGALAAGIGLQMAAGALFEFWEAVDEDQARRALGGGGAGGAVPGIGAPGAPALQPLEGAPEAGPDASGTGCPCSGSVPGGSFLAGGGRGAQIAFGFGGFGGF